MTDDKRLEFGLQPPTEARFAWGARAIYESNGQGGLQVSLLWDRQSAFGSESERALLTRVVDTWAMPMLRHLASKRALGEPYDRVPFEHRDGGWLIMANPNASHGYLYLCVAWVGEGEPAAPATFKAPKEAKRPARRRTTLLPRSRW